MTVFLNRLRARLGEWLLRDELRRMREGRSASEMALKGRITELEESRKRILRIAPGTKHWIDERNANQLENGNLYRGPSVIKQEPLRPWADGVTSKFTRNTL